MTIKPNFSGELQLAGWSESHTGGCKVTFWLSSPDDLQAFRTLTVRKGNTAGQRFAAVLVEIGDDEMPVTPPESPPQPEKPKGGPLAKLAGMWANDPEFWAWLTGFHPSENWNAETSAAYIRNVCGVESRVELDHDPEAAALFHEHIRTKFSKYLIARGIVR